MSARDELFEGLFEIADKYKISLTNSPDMHPGVPEIGDFCGDIEELVLAAGYSKPRTISTVEELDALPDGSVILDPLGLSLHKNGLTGWRASNGAKNISAEMLQHDALPATVLYTPKES